MKAWIAALMLLITCTNVAMVDTPGVDCDSPIQVASLLSSPASVSTDVISGFISRDFDHTNCAAHRNCHLGHCGFTIPLVGVISLFVRQVSEYGISTVRLVSAVLQTQKKPPKA